VAHGFVDEADKVFMVTSVDEILAQYGEQPFSAKEFDRLFGSLPLDAEG
jgi:hypothetical protein